MNRALARSGVSLDEATLRTGGHVPCPARTCYRSSCQRLGGKTSAPWDEVVITTRCMCNLLGAQARPDVQTGEDGGSGSIKVATFRGVRRNGRLGNRWDQA